jgi:hypothetical protein
VEFVSWQMVNIAEIRHELGVGGGQDATIPYNRPQGEPAILFLPTVTDPMVISTI